MKVTLNDWDFAFHSDSRGSFLAVGMVSAARCAVWDPRRIGLRAARPVELPVAGGCTASGVPGGREGVCDCRRRWLRIEATELADRIHSALPKARAWKRVRP